MRGPTIFRATLACALLACAAGAAGPSVPWWLPLPPRASASAAAAAGSAAVSTACSSGLPALLKTLNGRGGAGGASSSTSAVNELGSVLTATCALTTNLQNWLQGFLRGDAPPPPTPPLVGSASAATASKAATAAVSAGGANGAAAAAATTGSGSVAAAAAAPASPFQCSASRVLNAPGGGAPATLPDRPFRARTPTQCRGPALVLSVVGARCEAKPLPPFPVKCTSPSATARLLPARCDLEADAPAVIVDAHCGPFVVTQGGAASDESVALGAPLPGLPGGPPPAWPVDLGAAALSPAGIAGGLSAALTVVSASASASVGVVGA